MTYPLFTPEELAAFKAKRNAANIAQALAVKEAAAGLHMSLHLSGGKYNPAQMDYLLRFCNAVIGMVDDGDCMAQRNILMEELRCDEGGNPVRDEVA